MPKWTTTRTPDGCCCCLLETVFQTEATRRTMFYGCAEAVNDRCDAEQQKDPTCIVSGVTRAFPDGRIMREVLVALPLAA